MPPLIAWCFIGPQEPLTARKLKPTFVLLPFTTRHKVDLGSVAFRSYLWPFLDLYYTFLDCSHRCATVLWGRAGWWSVVFHSVQMLYTKWQSHKQLCSLTFWTRGLSVYQDWCRLWEKAPVRFGERFIYFTGVQPEKQLPWKRLSEFLLVRAHSYPCTQVNRYFSAKLSCSYGKSSVTLVDI